jgi:hypothetical protein
MNTFYRDMILIFLGLLVLYEDTTNILPSSMNTFKETWF